MKIKTPLTKQRLRTHFTYHLWKYLLAAALTVFCVNLLYTTTAYRSPETCAWISICKAPRQRRKRPTPS